MNKSTAKKWLLGVLILVMIYIWWDALSNTDDDTQSAYSIRQTTSTKSPHSAPSSGTDYEPAKVNPFYNGKANQTSPTKKPDVAPKRVPARVSDNYQLLGVLEKSSHSQAVLRSNDGATYHVEAGDTLGTWVLLSLDKNSCILGHDDYRDTIWLYNPETNF